MSTVAPRTIERTEKATETRIASYLLTEYLERLGVDVIFGLCGHTVIAFLDALGKSRIRFVSTRHEQVAAHAADGYARASGKTGVLLTHLGPGLTNACTGVANAALDSIPMVVIAGDVPSHYFGRHPHQEVNLHQDADQCQIYRPFCKRVYRVDRVEDLPRIMERAFHLAQAGRPGPVLVDVPMDIFSADLPIDAFQQLPARMSRPTLDAGTVARIVDALASAERPVLYAGGGVLSARATSELAALAEALEVPVAHTLMGKGCLREDHPLLLGQTGFWGTPISNDKCRTADLIVAIGTRLAEANSSSWDPRFTFSIPPTRLIHIDADQAEIGRNYPTELGAWPTQSSRSGRSPRRRAAKAIASEAACATRSRAAGRHSPPTGITSGARINSRCGPNGFSPSCAAPFPRTGSSSPTSAGTRTESASSFPSRFPARSSRPSGLATMGFGPSAVLGVKMAYPDRAAVSLIGDGGFSTNPSVIATAMEAELPVVWLVMDNAGFGTIAGLESMHYGSSFGCMFERCGKPYRVDYAAMARACGARGVMIESAADLGPALREALTSALPTVIQAPMENAPTPTPGHWNINDIYRKGE